MPERTERLTTRIPAGAIPPGQQVELAVQVVTEVGRLSALAEAKREGLEAALKDLRLSLATLAAAGVLAGVSLVLREGEEAMWVSVLFAPEAVGEWEEADLSAVRLLVGPEAAPSLEIICADCALSRKLVDRLLPSLAAETLACAQLRWQTEEPEPDLPAGDESEDEDEDEGEGEWDEYDDDVESRG